MTAFFDFDEILRNFGFNNGLMKNMQIQFDEIEKMIKNGELKGKWDIKTIDEPRMKGYVIQGRFWSDQLIKPFDSVKPIKPLERRPMPKRPFKVPETALKEIREPLTDVFEENKTVKIYLELPGEEKDDIQLNMTEEKVEVKTKKFYKTINIPTRNIDIKKTSSKYKNGVLEVTIPKKSPEKDTRKININ